MIKSIHRKNLDKCGDILAKAIDQFNSQIEALRDETDEDPDLLDDVNFLNIADAAAKLATADARLVLAEIQRNK